MSDEQPTGYIPKKNQPSYGKVTVTFEGEEGIDILVFDKATMPTIKTEYEPDESFYPWEVRHISPPSIKSVSIEFKPLRDAISGGYFTLEHKLLEE